MNGPSSKKSCVLFMGARHRNILGDDGISLPTTKMNSDEWRVWSFNIELKKSETRVITMNKGIEEDHDFHYDVDFKGLRWTDRFNEWIKNKGVVITDIYLDYFFFLPSW